MQLSMHGQQAGPLPPAALPPFQFGPLVPSLERPPSAVTPPANVLPTLFYAAQVFPVDVLHEVAGSPFP
jgi:hypothetical protein